MNCGIVFIVVVAPVPSCCRERHRRPRFIPHDNAIAAFHSSQCRSCHSRRSTHFQPFPATTTADHSANQLSSCPQHPQHNGSEQRRRHSIRSSRLVLSVRDCLMPTTEFTRGDITKVERLKKGKEKKKKKTRVATKSPRERSLLAGHEIFNSERHPLAIAELPWIASSRSDQTGRLQ